MGSRDGPAADTRPTGHVQRLPGIAVVSAGQAQIGRSQAQIENRIQHAGKFEIQQPSGMPGDGETRTRTGDTTIFSRYVPATAGARNPWETRGSGAVTGLPRMFRVCGRFRPIQGTADGPSPLADFSSQAQRPANGMAQMRSPSGVVCVPAWRMTRASADRRSP